MRLFKSNSKKRKKEKKKDEKKMDKCPIYLKQWVLRCLSEKRRDE